MTKLHKSNKISDAIISVLLALVFLFFTRRGLAQIIDPSATILDVIAQAGKLEVGSESVNERLHVYFVFKDKVFITSDNSNNTSPSSNGEYITWVKEENNGKNVFLYHVPTDTLLQVTKSGISDNPKVFEGKVVWESWVDGTWQILFYDGIRVSQITSGDPSINPEIYGDNIVFARKSPSGEWRTEWYQISTGETNIIATGLKAKNPIFIDGEIAFLLDQLKLLESSPSAIPESSPSTTQESSPSATPESSPSATPESSESATPTEDEQGEDEQLDELKPDFPPIPRQEPIPEEGSDEPEQVSNEETQNEINEAIGEPLTSQP